MTAYSNLGLVLPVPNDPSVANIWGTILNTNDTLLDGNLAGVLDLNVAGSANVPLTFTNGAPSQTTNMVFNCSGTLTGNIVVLFPAGMTKTFLAVNNTGGAYSLSFGVNNGSGAPAGTTITVPQGGTVICWSDGTNVAQALVGVYAPLDSPTFTGTVTGPDGAKWTSSGLSGLASLEVNGGGSFGGGAGVEVTAGNVTVGASGAATILIMAAGQNARASVFISTNSADWASADCFYDGTTITVANLQSGGGCTIQGVGGNLQVVNSTGLTRTLCWKVS